jgi:hypothetical protein
MDRSHPLAPICSERGCKGSLQRTPDPRRKHEGLWNGSRCVSSRQPVNVLPRDNVMYTTATPGPQPIETSVNHDNR